MKWYLTGDRNVNTIGYKLSTASETLMEMSLKIHRQSVRIIRKGINRLFFLEKCGLWANKMILKNEYGIEIGRSAFNIWQSNSGNIHFNNDKFHYEVLTKDDELIVQIMDNNHSRLYEIPVESEGLNSFLDKKNIEEYCALLLGFCWFMSEEFQENNVNHAISL